MSNKWKKKGLLTARVFAKANANVPFRLMNSINEPVVIKKGTMIDTFEPVTAVKENNIILM